MCSFSTSRRRRTWVASAHASMSNSSRWGVGTKNAPPASCAGGAWGRSLGASALMHGPLPSYAVLSCRPPASGSADQAIAKSLPHMARRVVSIRAYGRGSLDPRAAPNTVGFGHRGSPGGDTAPPVALSSVKWAEHRAGPLGCRSSISSYAPRGRKKIAPPTPTPSPAKPSWLHRDATPRPAI